MGTAKGLGLLSQFIFAGVCSFLVDKIGPKFPFFVIMVLDYFYAILAIMLGCCCGLVKNDIQERKMRRFEVRETIHELSKE